MQGRWGGGKARVVGEHVRSKSILREYNIPITHLPGNRLSIVWSNDDAPRDIHKVVLLLVEQSNLMAFQIISQGQKCLFHLTTTVSDGSNVTIPRFLAEHTIFTHINAWVTDATNLRSILKRWSAKMSNSKATLQSVQVRILELQSRNAHFCDRDHCSPQSDHFCHSRAYCHWNRVHNWGRGYHRQQVRGHFNMFRD
jgi:hypothetical protein